MDRVVNSSQDAGSELPAKLFDYDVLEFLGEGAGSVLYAVSHPKTRQLYAMKHVVRRTDKDQRFIEQLEAEYEVGRRVTHAGLRRSIEVKFNRTLLRKITEAALVLDLFDGIPLEAHPPTDLPRIVGCFIQTAQALESLHALGYVHCDLKPNNILMDSHGLVKVIDLGQACPIGTAKARIQGTPDYISPEQVKRLPVSPRTDVFNFGATLYWAVSGRTLPTLFTIKRSENSFLVDTEMASPASINSTVPEPLSNFVMECVRTNPEKRPADMTEVIRRLELIQHMVTRRTMPPRAMGKQTAAAS